MMVKFVQYEEILTVIISDGCEDYYWEEHTKLEAWEPMNTPAV